MSSEASTVASRTRPPSSPSALPPRSSWPSTRSPTACSAASPTRCARPPPPAPSPISSAPRRRHARHLGRRGRRHLRSQGQGPVLLQGRRGQQGDPRRIRPRLRGHAQGLRRAFEHHPARPPARPEQRHRRPHVQRQQLHRHRRHQEHHRHPRVRGARRRPVLRGHPQDAHQGHADRQARPDPRARLPRSSSRKSTCTRPRPACTSSSPATCSGA